MFFHVCGVKIYLDEKVLGEIQEVPTEGICSFENKICSKKFLVITSKLGEDKSIHLFKKQMNCDYQLVFESVNKVLIPRSKKTNGTLKVALFVMEVVSSFQ